jgi:hypothetical protein
MLSKRIKNSGWASEKRNQVNGFNNDETLLNKLMAKNKVGQANIICIANYGFRHFTLNSIMSLKRNSCEKFLVFCYDKHQARFLSDHGYKDNAFLIPRNWLDYDISEDATDATKKEYKQMCQSKIGIVYKLLKRGNTVLYNDPDIVWLSSHVKAHIEFSLSHSFAEIVFAQDQTKKSSTLMPVSSPPSRPSS